MDDFFLPGLPPVVQEAFRRLLNKGIKKRHLSQDVWEHEHKKEQITDFPHNHGIADIDYKVINFYVDGDADTYYPVVIRYITAIRGDFPSAVHIEIVRNYDWTAPDSWNTPTHRGGLQVYIDTFLSSWGGMQYYMDIMFGQTYSTMVADITVGAHDTSTIIIWLRGGHALYRLIAGTKTNISITPYIGDYKHLEGTSYETVYSPKTTVEEAFNYKNLIRKFSTISDQYIGGGYRNPKNGKRLATLDDIKDVAPGVIFAYAGSTPPSGYLECNGQAVSRTTYANLFAAIGTTWGAGNGSTTFNVPDLRGEFLRGWDHGRGVDPGREFGSWQADIFKEHNHVTDSRFNKLSARASDIDNQGTTTGADAGNATIEYRIAAMNDSLWGSATIKTEGGPETRPRNKAVMYIIKY